MSPIQKSSGIPKVTSFSSLSDKSFEEQFKVLMRKLSDELGFPIIYGLQAEDKPKYPDDYPEEKLRGRTRYPYIAYTFQSVRRVANIPFDEPTEDGQDVKRMYAEQFEFTISFTGLSEANKSFESVEVVRGLQDWLKNIGKLWLERQQIVVVSETPILPRDFFMVNDYERRNGTDIRLRLGRKVEFATPRILNVDVHKIEN